MEITFKNSRYFQQPVVLKILIFALVFVFLSIQPVFEKKQILPALLLIFIWPSYRIPLFIAGSVFASIFSSTYLSSSRMNYFYKFGPAAQSPDIVYIILIGGTSLCALMAIYFIFKKIIVSLSTKSHIDRQTLTTLMGFLCFGGLVYLTSFQKTFEHVTGFIILLAFMFVKSFWHFGLYVSARNKSGDKKLLHSIVPFWNATYVARETLDLNSYTPKSSEEERALLKSGLFLITRALVVFALLYAINRLYFFHYLTIHYPFYLPPWRFLGYESHVFKLAFSHFTLSEKIAFAFIRSNNLIFAVFFIYSDFYIGVARSCGFNLQTQTNKPWLARNFNDFMNRMMYYYSIIILGFFLYPLTKLFSRFIKNRNLKTFASTLLSIFIGGLFIRSIRDSDRLFEGHLGPSYLQIIFKLYSIYFFAFGFFSACSRVIKLPERITSKLDNVLALKYSRPLFFHLLHCLLLFLGAFGGF